jgi:hypothetical protein
LRLSGRRTDSEGQKVRHSAEGVVSACHPTLAAALFAKCLFAAFEHLRAVAQLESHDEANGRKMGEFADASGEALVWSLSRGPPRSQSKSSIARLQLPEPDEEDLNLAGEIAEAEVRVRTSSERNLAMARDSDADPEAVAAASEVFGRASEARRRMKRQVGRAASSLDEKEWFLVQEFLGALFP